MRVAIGQQHHVKGDTMNGSKERDQVSVNAQSIRRVEFFKATRLRCGLSLALVMTVGLVQIGMAVAEKAPIADTIITNAKIYSHAKAAVSPNNPYETAMAIQGDKVLAIGDVDSVMTLRGSMTKVINLHQRVVLPGLIDSHIHPLDIVDLDVCDLHSQSLSLEQISAVVAQCIKHYKPANGQWLKVHQWNYTNGNQLSPRFKTLRQALDAAAPNNPVTLLGNDGHHGAYNSAALALAKPKTGANSPLTRASLLTTYAPYRTWIGVDAAGEPDGTLNENARYLVDSTGILMSDLDEIAKAPARVVKRLNASGITAVLDAAAGEQAVGIYETLSRQHELTVWTNLALYFDPYSYTNEQGVADFDGMLRDAKRLKARIEQDPTIKADTVKLFADGVLEGNPYATPPTLPNSPGLSDYLQPIYQISKNALPKVVGYVDTNSEVCIKARADGINDMSPTTVVAFRKAHGYHPAQCLQERGRFQDSEAIETQFVKRFHEAGFSVHIHAISDAAVHLSVSAIEAARQDGNLSTRDGLAHVQLATPEDVKRIGQDHLFVAYTFAWAIGDPEYDLSVVPFIQKVRGNRFADMHPTGSRYDQMVYPVKDTQVAGAIITAGSDAPVETTDPRPFVNLTRAVSRQLPTSKDRLVPRQALTIQEALDAYTINGARALGREQTIGTLEVGKSADFIVIDTDPLALAKTRQWGRLEATQVLATYFQGRRVYQRTGSPAALPSQNR